MATNPYRRPGARPPVSCLARGIDPDGLDAILARRAAPVRAGEGNPWKACLRRIELRSHSMYHDKQSTLALALLPFGGAGVVMRGPDRDEADILARGQLWPGHDALIVGGRTSACHANSAHLWAAEQERVALVTGYALSDDGLWRQHSWCVRPADGGRVLETTERNLLYFGFGMTADEALAFHESNVGGRPRLARAPIRPEPEPSPAPAP